MDVPSHVGWRRLLKKGRGAGGPVRPGAGFPGQARSCCFVVERGAAGARVPGRGAAGRGVRAGVIRWWGWGPGVAGAGGVVGSRVARLTAAVRVLGQALFGGPRWRADAGPRLVATWATVRSTFGRVVLFSLRRALSSAQSRRAWRSSWSCGVRFRFRPVFRGGAPGAQRAAAAGGAEVDPAGAGDRAGGPRRAGRGPGGVVDGEVAGAEPALDQLPRRLGLDDRGIPGGRDHRAQVPGPVGRVAVPGQRPRRRRPAGRGARRGARRVVSPPGSGPCPPCGRARPARARRPGTGRPPRRRSSPGRRPWSGPHR